jgi:hypothetical protein
MENLRNKKESPYREIFEQLESYPYSSIDAYTLYYDWAETNGIDPCVYLSSAITSGGLARDPNIPFGEMMDTHTEFGDRMAYAIAAQKSDYYITREDIVAPADLGKVSEWGQADYLLFWAHVITGLDPREAEMIDEYVQQKGITKLRGFSDKTLSREQKWQDYSALVETYVDAMEIFNSGKGENGMERPRNIQTVVPILDPAESLGVNAERYLCHLLGLGEYNFELQPEHLHEHTVQLLDRMKLVGATALEQGEGSVISGVQNTNAYRNLKTRGVRWRAPGFYGIYERRYSDMMMPIWEENERTRQKLSPAEMWAKQADDGVLMNSDK